MIFDIQPKYTNIDDEKFGDTIYQIEMKSGFHKNDGQDKQ